MSKVKISDIAKELGCSGKEVLEKISELGLNVKAISSSVSEEEAGGIYEYITTNEIPQIFKNLDKKLAKNTKKTSKKEKTPKEEIIEEKIIKEEALKEENQIPNQTTTQRRGLVIVKKKNNDTKKEQNLESAKINERINLKDIFTSHNEIEKKLKKKDKKSPVSKKENTIKMNLLEKNDFKDLSLEDEDVIILPDFNENINPIKTETYTKKQTPVFAKQNLNQFIENSIQRKSRKKAPKKIEKKDKVELKSINIAKEIRVYELAEKLEKNTSEIISKLFMLGLKVTKNDFLDADTIEILADEFNIEINIINEEEKFDYVKDYENQNINQNLSPRVPVITIMGHVDHGKTSLLDYIRKSHITNSEAGGITQHVGAYMIEKNNHKITFIDTPGHEAFSAMRARGASVTDIVIIVVAADDGVKPQTKEAINHAKLANVPIIIAINKIDKENANIDKVKSELAELDITPTEWGGTHEFVEISAKNGTGIENLLELLILQAELLELKADSKAPAKASIIECSIQKGRGTVATIIMQNGSLKVGDIVVAGIAYGKIKGLFDDQGKILKEIKPGECGIIIGLNEISEAGQILISVKDEKEARNYANTRYEYERAKTLSKSTKVSIEELGSKIKEGKLKSLPIILKTDVQGSLEAIKTSLERLNNDEIKIDIIHSGIGGITQSDIDLASTSNESVILGFNIRPTGDIKEKAKEKKVNIKTYNIIYNLIDDIKALLSGLMSPVVSEEQLGQALIRQVIFIPKIGQIAGCMVSDGVINRGAKIRLIRDGIVIFEGNISSLKRFKDDVKEVAKGFECGVGIQGCNDMKEGDFIESYKEIEQSVKLD